MGRNLGVQINCVLTNLRVLNLEWGEASNLGGCFLLQLSAPLLLGLNSWFLLIYCHPTPRPCLRVPVQHTGPSDKWNCFPARARGACPPRLVKTALQESTGSASPLARAHRTYQIRPSQSWAPQFWLYIVFLPLNKNTLHITYILDPTGSVIFHPLSMSKASELLKHCSLQSSQEAGHLIVWSLVSKCFFSFLDSHTNRSYHLWGKSLSLITFKI